MRGKALWALVFLVVTGPGSLAQQRLSVDLIVQTDSMPDNSDWKWSPGSTRFLLTGAGKVLLEPGLDIGEKDIPTTATLWDIATGRELRELRGHSKPVVCTGISPDASTLLTVSDDRTARLWDAATGHEFRRLDTANFTPTTCSWSRQGNLIALGGDTGSVRIYAGRGFLLTRTLAMSGQTIQDLAYSPDGTMLAAADGKQLIILNIATGIIRKAGQGICTVLWSSDGKTLYAGVEDDITGLKEVDSSVWNPHTMKELDQDGISGQMWPPPISKSANLGTSDDSNDTAENAQAQRWQFDQLNSGASVRFVGRDKSLLVFSGGRGESSLTIWGLNGGQPLQVFRNVIDPFDSVSVNGMTVCIEPDLALNRESDKSAAKLAAVDALTGGEVPIDNRSFNCAKSETSSARSKFGDDLIVKYDLEGWSGGVSPDRRYFVAQEDDAAYVHESATGSVVAMCLGRAVRFSWDSSRLLCSNEQGVPRVITLGSAVSDTAKENQPALELQDHVLMLRNEGKTLTLNNVESFLSAPEANRVLIRMIDDSVRVVTYSGLELLSNLHDVPFDASLGQGYDDWASRYRSDFNLGFSDEVWNRSYRSEAISAGFSSTGDMVAIGGRGGTYLFDVSTGNKIASIYSFGTNGWAVVTADGRFDSNQLDGRAPLHWVASDSPFTPLPLDIFMRLYYTPGLLASVLSHQKLTEIRGIAQINRVQPDVKIVSVKASSQNRFDVTVHANSHMANGKRSGLNDLRLFRDGQMVGGALVDLQAACSADGKARRLSGGYVDGTLKSCDFTFRNVRLKRDASEVTFTAYAFNDDRVKSATASLRCASSEAQDSRSDKKKCALWNTPLTHEKETRRAYLLQIGVNHYAASRCELNYSVNDAEKMSAELADRLKAQGYDVQAVKLESAKNGETAAASKEAIHEQLAAIASKATPDDVFFMSFSGHGYSAENGEFYILPSDIQGSCRAVNGALLKTAISADELTDWLRPIDAGGMTVILDACFSAESVEAGDFKPGPLGSRGLGQLAYDKRMRVLAASQSDEVAHEYDYLQQGLLTYFLTNEGLDQRKADWKPADNKIMVGEWLAYAATAVPNFIPDQSKAVTSKAARDRFGSSSTNTLFQIPALFDFSKADTLSLQ